LRSGGGGGRRKQGHVGTLQVVGGSRLKRIVREMHAAQLRADDAVKCTEQYWQLDTAESSKISGDEAKSKKSANYSQELRQLLQLPRKRQEIVSLDARCACAVVYVDVRCCSRCNCNPAMCRPSIFQLLGCSLQLLARASHCGCELILVVCDGCCSCSEALLDMMARVFER